ncbi:MAG: metallophosphoesterase [Leptospiraceae bacterium]|nr:metallophosphoesterase [Leptospiraceae bacterium]
MDLFTNRKTFLASAGLIASSAFFNSSNLEAKNNKKSRKKVLRIAHITDIHIKPSQKAKKGLEKALHSIQSLKHPPDFILNGGDSILDSMFASKSTTKSLWKTFQSIIKEECSIPIYHCIGNHDVWGWGGKNSFKKDHLYGKSWVQEELNIKNPFYSFDRSNWRFVVLDSVHPNNNGYIAKLDDIQYDWLEKILYKTNMESNVCILSHIPIICFCATFDGQNEKSGNWNIPGAWMHIDARKIKTLFTKFKNVKLALSGHIHLHDKVEYLGVKYLCNGAVSGAWWKGSYQEVPPSYSIIDLYNDGSSENYFIPYS